jgi:hypothetical protein
VASGLLEKSTWIGRSKLSERQLSAITPSKAAVPLPADAVEKLGLEDVVKS